MVVKIVNWADVVTEVEIGNIEDIATMKITVLTGDEILHVVYKDYTTADFDSSGCRMRDYYDGEYEIYDFRKPKEENLLFNNKWLASNNSYKRMRLS